MPGPYIIFEEGMLRWARQEFSAEPFYSEYSKLIKPKPTLLEKVKLMWERQPYFKTLPSKAYIKAKEVKPKPYWRANERW